MSDPQPHIVKDMPKEKSSKHSSPRSPKPQPQVMHVTIQQPVNAPYIVVPASGRQADNVIVDVVPVSKPNQVILVNANPDPIMTICTESRPQLFYCGICRKTQLSVVTPHTSKANLCCWITLCILLFPFSLCFIWFVPFMTEEVIHTCPGCAREVGRAPALL